jgi:hypothetical protein
MMSLRILYPAPMVATGGERIALDVVCLLGRRLERRTRPRLRGEVGKNKWEKKQLITSKARDEEKNDLVGVATG